MEFAVGHLPGELDQPVGRGDFPWSIWAMMLKLRVNCILFMVSMPLGTLGIGQGGHALAV